MHGSRNKEGVLAPWVHVTLWYLTVALMLALILATWGLLDGWSRGLPADRVDLVVWGGGFVLLIAIMVYWGRHLFFHNNLKQILRDRRAATDLDVRGRRLRARLGGLWLVVNWDHPVMDYSPWRGWRQRLSPSSGVEADRSRRRSPGTHYMFETGRSNVFLLGDFAQLSPRTIHLRGDDAQRRSSLCTSGVSGLDRAIGKMLDELSVDDPEFLLEIAPHWIRLEVKVGSWLGPVFGHRVLKGVDLMQRLVLFMPPELKRRLRSDASVELDGDGFTVVPR